METMKDVGIVLFRIVCFLAVWVLIGWIACSICFGGSNRRVARYKISPTNVVVRIDGTNCYVRYMRDLLLNTNLVVSCEPFDPPPLASTNNVMEVENE